MIEIRDDESASWHQARWSKDIGWHDPVDADRMYYGADDEMWDP